MAEFTYNNAKIVSTSYILFKLNYSYHSQVLFKEDIDLYSESYFANKLVEELSEFMKICYKNLLYILKL